jgi:hypothetical protein
MSRKLTFALAACLAAAAAPAAAADGFFAQADIGDRTQSAVATASRGALSYGTTLSNYEGGRSGTTFLAYTLPLEAPATVRLGPAVGLRRSDGEAREVEAGLRVAVDRWSATPFGSVYGLAEASSVHRSWFLLGQVTFAPANIGVELSRGGSEDYHETTLAVQKRLGEGPVSLRLGYKLSSDEIFAGISINTF